MGKKSRNKTSISEAPIEKIDVLSDGEKEIFEVPKEVIKEALVPEEPEHKREFMAKIVDVDLLNIRNKPNGDILSQANKSVVLKIVDINPTTDGNGEDWYNVILPIGLEGWAMSKFLYIFEEGQVKEV